MEGAASIQLLTGMTTLPQIMAQTTTATTALRRAECSCLPAESTSIIYPSCGVSYLKLN